MKVEYGDGNWIEFHIADSLEYLPMLPDARVDLVLTDPPFGQQELIHSGYGRSELGHRYISGDQDLSWLTPMTRQLWRVLGPRGWLVSFVQWRTLDQFLQAYKSTGFEVKTVGVWAKANGGLGEGLVEGYENIIFARKPGARERGYRTNVFTHVRPGRQEHPHWKPEGLLEEIITLLTEEGATVLDPFLGSGSTLLACRRTRRNGIGIEIDPKYEAVIRRRVMADQRDLWAYSRPLTEIPDGPGPLGYTLAENVK